MNVVGGCRPPRDLPERAGKVVGQRLKQIADWRPVSDFEENFRWRARQEIDLQLTIAPLPNHADQFFVDMAYH